MQKTSTRAWRRLGVVGTCSALAMAMVATQARADVVTLSAPAEGTAATAPSPTELAAFASHPALAAIRKDALDAFKYSLAVVAADPGATYAPGSVEEALKAGVDSLPEPKRKRASELAGRIVNAPIAQRTAAFGSAGQLTATQVRKSGLTAELQRGALLPAFNRTLADLVKSAPAIEKAAPGTSRDGWVKELRVVVDRVICIDETEPEPFNQDKILLSALRVEPTNGAVTPLSATKVGMFGDGGVVDYPSGHLLNTFDLTQGGGPLVHTYTTMVVLAEADHGGFVNAVREAGKRIAEKIRQVAADAVKQNPQLQKESDFMIWFASFLVSEVLAGLFLGIVDYVSDLLQDDLFPVVPFTANLPSFALNNYLNPENENWTSYRSPGTTLTFNGHGGRYQLDLHLEVS